MYVSLRCKTDIERELGLGGNVVKRLTRNITGHNYTVYCDNFLTSAPLFRDLLEDKIYACSMYNTTRKCYPKDLKDKAKSGIGSRGNAGWKLAGNNVAGYKNCLCLVHQLPAKL